jgi:hypothetical protein
LCLKLTKGEENLKFPVRARSGELSTKYYEEEPGAVDES